MRSKGDADAALCSSALDWVVLRPGLVLSPDAYGGTALLRAMAGMPWVQPIAFSGRPIQTVSVDDVAVQTTQLFDYFQPALHCTEHGGT